MKRITELTEEEILSLTEEQTDDIIKYECANSGVKILPEPIEPTNTISSGDLKRFEVNGFIFEKIEDAQDFLDKAILSKKYDWNYGLDIKYEREHYDWDLVIKEVNIFSKGKLSSIETEAAEHKKLKEKYEKDKKEYDANHKEVLAIVDKVNEVIQKVKDKYEKLDTLAIQMEEYLRLSEGDRKVAFNFLNKNWGPLSKDEREYISLKFNINQLKK